MKKLEKAFGLALALAASAAFFACKTEEPEPKPIETLTVKAVPHPGANYLDWPSVPTATKYKVFRKDDDGRRKLLDVTNEKVSDYMDADGALQDKKAFVYEVIALDKNNDTCAKGEAKVTANMPKAHTPALELANSGEGEKLTAKTIMLDQKDGGNIVTVSFPAKSFLKYTVTAEMEDADVPFSNGGKLSETFAKRTAGDGKGVVTLMLEQAGVYSIKIRVEAYNKLYVPSEVVAEKKITFAAKSNSVLKGKIISAKYEDSKTVCIKWEPAQIDGNAAPASMYKVSRSYADKKAEAVTAEIKTEITTEGQTIYSVFDKPAKTEVTNIYKVVIDDGNGRVETLSKSVPAYKKNLSGMSVAESIESAYINNTTIRISWEPAKIDGKEALPAAYKVYRAPEYSSDPVDVSKLLELAADGKVIKTGKSADGKTTRYYVEIKPAVTSVTNYYAIALDDKTNYGATNTVNVAKYDAENALPEIEGSARATLKRLDKDTLTNDLVVTVSEIETGASVAISYAKMPDGGSAASLTDADYQAITPLKDGIKGQKIAVKKDLPEGAYAVRVLLTKTGRKNRSILIDKDNHNYPLLKVAKASRVYWDDRYAVFTVQKQLLGDKLKISLKDFYDKTLSESYYTYAIHYAEAEKYAASDELVVKGEWKEVKPVVMERTAENESTCFINMDAKDLKSRYIFRATKSHGSEMAFKYADPIIDLIPESQKPTTEITIDNSRASLSGTVVAEWDRSKMRFSKWQTPEKSSLKFTVRPNRGASAKDDASKVQVWIAEVESASRYDVGAIQGDDENWYKPKDSFKNVTAVSTITQNPKLTPNDLYDDYFDCTVEVPAFLAAYGYFVTYEVNGELLFSKKEILKAGNRSDLEDNLKRRMTYPYPTVGEEKTYVGLSAGSNYYNRTHWTAITVKVTGK